QQFSPSRGWGPRSHRGGFSTLCLGAPPRSLSRRRLSFRPRNPSKWRAIRTCYVISSRPILAITLADFRERTRRYSFFLTLLFAVFLGYAAASGKIFLQFDEYRGVYTSGWTGTLVALVITCFVSLVGFYIVKNAVQRDRSTGVGQILAATPISTTTYAFGKFLSNFAVLSSMVAILALAALLMQIWMGEDNHIDLWALLSPFLLLALPTIALTAVLALCFEMFTLLRAGFGNVAWF